MNEHVPQQNNLDADSSEEQPKWKPLGRIERRVIGVLVEKAKTTPDAYPLTLNSITTACNQKSNRSPQMDLDSDDVLMSLDRLREIGAVIEIQGTGRVAKYKHEMYRWLGVDKIELAVVAELLLRGQQTLGELRARAGRMESIAGISELKPICTSLMAKKLMVSLTPEGRGQIVDHGLYLDNEKPAAVDLPITHGDEVSTATPVRTEQPMNPTVQNEHSASIEFGELRSEIQSLKNSLDQLEQRLEKIETLIN